MAENVVLLLVFADRLMGSQEGLWFMELVWILVENIIIIIEFLIHLSWDM
jgi:hypothetical protein